MSGLWGNGTGEQSSNSGVRVALWGVAPFVLFDGVTLWDIWWHR